MKTHTILQTLLAISLLLSIGITSYLHGIYLGLCMTAFYAISFAAVFYTNKVKSRKIEAKNNKKHEYDLNLLYKAFFQYKENLLSNEFYEDCILIDSILNDLENKITPPAVYLFDIEFLNLMFFEHGKNGVEIRNIKAYKIVGKKESVV